MSNNKKIAVGCDHAGVDFKNEIIGWLNENGFLTHDLGCFSGEAVDYPDIAEGVCEKITSKECDLGILICGTGVGMSMAANKIKGIRAANAHDYFSAKYTRLHNDANVLCMGARVIGIGMGIELTSVFLSTEFEGGRHARRVDKITALER